MREVQDKHLEACNRKLHPNLPKLHFVLGMVCPRGTGKSNIIINLISENCFYLRNFHKVFIFSPTFHNDTKWENINIDDSQVFDELDDKAFPQFVEENLNNDDSKLLILDDLGSLQKHKNFERFLIRHRHFNTSIIIANQYFKFIGRAIRSNMTDLIVGKIQNVKEIEDIALEFDIDKEAFRRMVPKVRFDFIYLDFRGNRIFRRFEELLVAPEE